MTRDELVKILMQGENYRIVVGGYEDGYDDINSIKIIKMFENYNTEKDSNEKSCWYCGKHSDINDPYNLTDEEKAKAIPAVFLNFDLKEDNKKYE